MSSRKFLPIILLTLFMIVAGSQLLAASFTIDSLNLQEALPISNPPQAYFRVDLKEAWKFINDFNPNLSPITIGIVDSGFDSIHPEFKAVKLGNTPLDAKIDIGELINGDLKSHGTNVAGIIGANNISATSSDNYILPHMNGVMSGVKNLDYTLEIRRYSRSIGIVTLFSTSKKIFELSKNGAQIINLSSSGLFNPITEIVFGASFLAHPNILFVTAAGNDNRSAVTAVPANLSFLSNVITVGATTLDDKRVSDSNFGNLINVSAPGELVFSPTFFQEPFDLDDYEFFGGTSASAPMVTGVAGLIKAIKPELTPLEIKNILIQTADPIVTDKPIGGRLNAFNAVCDPLVLNCVPPVVSVWPMFQRNAQHTGLADVTGPPFSSSDEVTVKWQKNIGTFSLFASPLIAQDGTVYVGSDKTLFALNPDTGEEIWQSNVFDNTVTSGAISPDGTVYICAFGNEDPLTSAALYAINSLDGSLKWRFNLSTEPSLANIRACHPPIISSDGTIFTSTPQRIFSPFTTTLAIFALNPDGTERWRHEETDEFFVAPTAPALSNDESQLYVAFGSDFIAFRAEDGQIIWRQPAPRGNFKQAQAPTVDSTDRIIIGTDFFGLGNLIAFSKDGELLWQSEDLRQILSSSAVNKEGIIFNVPNGNILFTIDPINGTTIEQFVLPGFHNISAPAIDKNGIVYIGLFAFPFLPQTKGGLVAIGPEGFIWFFETKRVLHSPAIGMGGTLFFTSIPSGEAIIFALGI